MAHLAVTVEGGLISSDLVEQIAATPQDVMGQRPIDFGFDGRLSDEIQTTFSNAFIHWNAFYARLARGKESATTITRETWILPLLEELDFTLTFQRAAAVAGGVTFTISHRFGVEPDAPPVHIVSCDRELDRKGNEAHSPHALVQDFLNRSDALWGIVTNGLKLRLLRNTVRFSKPSFIEFDLEAIFKGNLYSEFVLFYRLVHATRLPRGSGDAHETWLERYYQQGLEQGGRVRERLRDGVEEALKILGTGFLAHPESNGLREKLQKRKLSHLDYYRELLRLIYQLLFLMVAEERRLLFVPDHENAGRQEIYDRWYSIERLRKRAMENRVFDDGHSDLWEGLKQTFTLFEDSRQASELGLTALNGELFGRFACADLIDTQHQAAPRLRNADLLAAIWYLSTFEDADGHKRRGVRRRVNFGGLDVEEFGSVYESLLDYHPEVTIDGSRSKFDLIVGSERKATGSYYTPPELVRELIKSALEPVIEERLAHAATHDDKIRALLSLKVCDPASGSGHFMLAAARRIGRELARVRSGEAEPNPADYRHAVRDVIRRCIYAVDKNPLAVDLCKVALWIEGHEPGLPLSFLDHHIKCGESLVGVFDLKVLEAGIPGEAYTSVTGDEKKVAGEIRKRNKNEAERDLLLRHSVQQDIIQISDAFGAIADLPETNPGEVHAKEAAYSALRESAEWKKAKWACDLWSAAFFAPLVQDNAETIPTTRDVWDAIGGRQPKGPVASTSIDIAAARRLFHWPLEFPEVIAAGGFDVILGNPPWEVLQFSDDEFFSTRAPEIAALSGVKRKKAIASLKATSPALWNLYQTERRLIDNLNGFCRHSGRYPLSTTGKLNTFALFIESSVGLLQSDGRSGLIVPTSFLSDESLSRLFGHLIDSKQLISSFAFENEEFIFPGIANVIRFALITLKGVEGIATDPEFAFFLRHLEDMGDSRRIFSASATDFKLLNPNTLNCPIFRSASDAALTKKIYAVVPIFVSDDDGSDDIEWHVTFRKGLYNTASDSHLFKTKDDFIQQGCQLRRGRWDCGVNGEFVPLYEGKFVWFFDHRFGSFHNRGVVKGRGGRGLPPVAFKELSNPYFVIEPQYWVSKKEVERDLADLNWTRDWLFGWRDIANAKVERTIVPAIIPRTAVADTFYLAVLNHTPKEIALLLANLSSLTLDYVARQKIGGTHLSAPYIKQLPVLQTTNYSNADSSFILQRILELVYTAEDLKAFASDLGYDGSAFGWDSKRRGVLRAELDAYYAYLYGLTRRELEYTLDPKAVMGADYPSETFRVLKENELKEFGEYCTQRLVLEAWDRFVANGTFDPARLREPQYIDRVAAELSSTRDRLEETERNYLALMKRARETPKPTLFVEGVTDSSIIQAAWSVFFPREPIPFEILAAEGTKQMGSLAGKGKALRALLGDRVVFALADNDCEGRALIDDGHIRKGGVWRQLPNGIHWCLLKPTADFAAVMKAHEIPPANWPFTIEEAFPPALRRQAVNDGAWRFAATPQAELLDNANIAKRLFVLQSKLTPAADAYWYLMAPAPEAKEAFASWVTDPKRCTEDNYAAFEEVIRGLRDLVGRSQSIHRVRGAA